MRKLLLVLMPISLILALFGFYLSKDLNFNLLLTGLSTIEFKDFDYSSIQDAFNNLDIVSRWSNLGDIWTNVDGLVSFFNAIGDTFVIIFNGIGDIFKLLYNLVRFIFVFGSYLISNLIEFTKFLFNYIFS